MTRKTHIKGMLAHTIAEIDSLHIFPGLAYIFTLKKVAVAIENSVFKLDQIHRF